MTKEKQSGPDGNGTASTGSGQTLRRRAEEIAQKKAFQIPEHLESLSIEATRQMLHELRVHQIELEMQNDELRRTRGELEASRARYFDLYDLAPVGYFTLSEQGLILEVNLTAATLLGVVRGALVKKLLTKFIFPEDQDIYYRHRKLLFETHSASSGQAGAPQVFELRLVKKDAAPFWVRIDATAAQDPSTSSGQGADGAPLCRATMIDITDRKQIEAEIRKMNDELEQRVRGRTAQLEASNKELEAFSYSVSHDLRAPLRSIEGFSQALLEEYRENLDETGKNYLDRVCEAAKRMGMLIDDTLKLSRVAWFDFQCEAVDLSRMVRAILQTTQQTSSDRAVDVIIPEGIIVQGDPHLMKIALGNLLDNAWKFTGKAIQPRIEFGKTVKDDETAYYVRDNGVGFDMAYVDKLFGPFQRLHTTEEFAGTGIGLATVQRIIARHGGRVWAEGEVGKGAVFYFTLP
jgi:PAS domain S-box-containing protein